MSRKMTGSEIILLLCFLGIIFCVPLAQIVIEISAGKRAQFTDLFRYVPTERNLRRFEATLQKESWFQNSLRPGIQWFLFQVFQDMGSKGLMGKNGWVFFKPGVRYLTESDRIDADESGSVWIQPRNGTVQYDSVVRIISGFRDRLENRGIRLLVVPVPGKASVYPEMLTRRAMDGNLKIESPTLELMDDLQRHGVQTVNLFQSFLEQKPRQLADEALFLARDTHWTPTGAKLAAETVAQRIKALDWEPKETREYLTRPIWVKRYGDILEMIRMPGFLTRFPGEVVECEQVIDTIIGPMVPTGSLRQDTFTYPKQKASILVLGDSFCRIYQTAEPHSLGVTVERSNHEQPDRVNNEEVRRRTLLPGSAGFPSHLALALKAPIDYVINEGGEPTGVWKKLSNNAEIIEGKRLVIWEFSERDIRLGSKGWQYVPLSPGQ